MAEDDRSAQRAATDQHLLMSTGEGIAVGAMWLAMATVSVTLLLTLVGDMSLYEILRSGDSGARIAAAGLVLSSAPLGAGYSITHHFIYGRSNK